MHILHSFRKSPVARGCRLWLGLLVDITKAVSEVMNITDIRQRYGHALIIHVSD